ncbi:MAG: rRNA pseudouridine synthase [Oscillospiraceae bacterium]|nr:rRNA pseudouridine synthase [Oscillospiraceae bacterium]
MDVQRLDKFISNQCFDISRSGVKDLVKKGKVTVNGKVVKKADEKIDAESDEICVFGKRIVYKKHLYIMLNKPAGVVCATRDGLSPTVLALLPDELKREGLFPAGRLDKDTEGFVLITSDGDLAHKMLAPKSHVPKLYYVRLEMPLAKNAENEFKTGMTLLDGTSCLPAELERINEKECFVTLHEGMFHQVKRMFEALGNKVTYLKRVKIGGVDLDGGLALGEVRELTPSEVEKLLLR